MTPIHLIIADDHKIFRQSLSLLLEQEPHLKVIGEANNGEELKSLVGVKIPDLVLMDIEMPHTDGLAATKWLKSHYPKVRVLALTVHREFAFIQGMLKAGVDGYLLKDAGKEELLHAIEVLQKGEPYYDPSVTGQVMNSLRPHSPSSSDLSEREIEIVQLIADQLTSKQIAKKLNLSPLTIETHRKNIFLKLGVQNAAGLVKLAYSKGWIQ
ncbi:MAG: response regulator transcription factor [Bacteroidia bacterium]